MAKKPEKKVETSRFGAWSALGLGRQDEVTPSPSAATTRSATSRRPPDGPPEMKHMDEEVEASASPARTVRHEIFQVVSFEVIPFRRRDEWTMIPTRTKATRTRTTTRLETGRESSPRGGSPVHSAARVAGPPPAGPSDRRIVCRTGRAVPGGSGAVPAPPLALIGREDPQVDDLVVATSKKSSSRAASV
jgi:hypothetical protein